MARQALVTVAAAAGLLVGLAGCGSSTSTTSPTSVPVTSAPPGGSATSTGSAPTTAPGTIGTESTRYGTVLQSGGRTLYLLTADTPTASKCTSPGCQAVWPPLTGTVKAGPGVSSAKLGRVKLPDGRSQATYAGHPLYFYVGDGGSTQANGQGIASFGGTWYVVSAATGEAVTKAVSGGTGSTTSTTAKGSSGY